MSQENVAAAESGGKPGRPVPRMSGSCARSGWPVPCKASPHGSARPRRRARSGPDEALVHRQHPRPCGWPVSPMRPPGLARAHRALSTCPPAGSPAGNEHSERDRSRARRDRHWLMTVRLSLGPRSRQAGSPFRHREPVHAVPVHPALTRIRYGTPIGTASNTPGNALEESTTIGRKTGLIKPRGPWHAITEAAATAA